MNCVNLIGRLVAKPELRYTSSNIANTRFTIAVDRPFQSDGQRGVDFINVVAWRKSAENICDYLDKGSQIAIEGRIQTGSYTDTDGNNRKTFEVMAQNVQFLGSKRASEDSSEENVTDPYQEMSDEIDIDNNFLD
ncbi:MAG: single-stranded DNA-binding protein [Bacilli bacterium]